MLEPSPPDALPLGLPLAALPFGSPLMHPLAGPFVGPRSGAGVSFDPGDLFGGEDGDWWKPSDLSRMWQNTGKTTAVAADGDPVAVIEGQKDVHDLVQATNAKRPLYKTSAGKHWLLFDRVDDALWWDSLDLAGTWNWVMGHGGISNDFIICSKKETNSPWIGVGQSGSSSTALEGANMIQNDIYFDNVVSSATTRGGQYTLAAAANTMLIDFTKGGGASPDFGIGSYNDGSSFAGPTKVYSLVMIEKQLSSGDRASLETYQQALR